MAPRAPTSTTRPDERQMLVPILENLGQRIPRIELRSEAMTDQRTVCDPWLERHGRSSAHSHWMPPPASPRRPAAPPPRCTSKSGPGRSNATFHGYARCRARAPPPTHARNGCRHSPHQPRQSRTHLPAPLAGHRTHAIWRGPNDTRSSRRPAARPIARRTQARRIRSQIRDSERPPPLPPRSSTEGSGIKCRACHCRTEGCSRHRRQHATIDPARITPSTRDSFIERCLLGLFPLPLQEPSRRCVEPAPERRPFGILPALAPALEARIPAVLQARCSAREPGSRGPEPVRLKSGR